MTTELPAREPAPVKTLVRSCPLCGNDNAHAAPLRYGPAEWGMKACGQCTMVYLERAPDVSELYENLAWEKRFSLNNAERHDSLASGERTLRKALRGFRPLPRKSAVGLIEAHAPDGYVLDVGCGSGDHLARLPRRYVPVGIEISTALAQEAEARLRARGGGVINADALSALGQLGKNSFAGVIMRSFLEHDVNPAPILAEVSRVLLRGGIAVIKVPNYGSLNRMLRGSRWCGLRFPDHVNYFTPKTLRRAVEDAGLSVKRFGLTERPPTSDNMWLIAELVE